MKKLFIGLFFLVAVSNTAFTKTDCSVEHFTEVIRIDEDRPEYSNSLKELETILKTCTGIDQSYTTFWQYRNMTALIYSTIFVNVSKIKLLVSYGADINKQEIGGKESTPLTIASSRPSFKGIDRFNKAAKVAKFFIDNGARVNLSNKYNESPLMLASKSGKLKLVKYLVKAGANINQTDVKGLSAIFWAARHSFRTKEKLKILKFLIKNGANVNQQSHKSRITALMWAALSGNLKAVKVLLNANANINAEQTSGKTAGYTALAWAAKKGHCKIVNFLKKAGATKVIGCK